MMRTFPVIVFVVATLAMASAGCSRAIREGIAIGVTNGLSDGISTLIGGLLTPLTGGA